jgi:hypothetical protein
MDPDQPAHPRSLIRIHAVRLPKSITSRETDSESTNPDQTARMRRLVWIHAGRKRTMLVCRDAAHMMACILVYCLF